MTKFIWHEDSWVQAVRAPPRPRLAIIRDGMEPLRHMVDGNTYDSKSEFRRVTRERGYIEVGNEKSVASERPRQTSVKEDIVEAWQMVEQGYVQEPLPDVADGELGDLPIRILNANG